jgi:hypothetical protein
MHCDGISTQMKQGYWPRGGDVTIVGTQVHCRLDFGRGYELAKECRKYSAHAKFLRCETEQQLTAFIRAWGPLSIVLMDRDGGEWGRGISVRPVIEYRAFQRRLKALANLLASCREGRLDGRSCLLEYLDADKAWCALDPIYSGPDSPDPHSSLRLLFSAEMNPSDWLKQIASQSDVRSVVSFVLQTTLTETISLSVTHDGKQFQVAQKWGMRNLGQTLEWLLWADRLGFCPECGELFKITSYRWKYCTDECAHRATDREWRSEWRKNHKNRRKEENARKSRAAKKGRRK